ncbi:hypothetical protein FOXG_21621 [Fusarium oxysporum f. sp. lycopersici 4287]|uniref:Uncharacterized protein n=2 Tax=Fusarium oxysporum TaxID=5507 RepID=A0A0J9VZG0_FUSO4|nr:hypothetical protein FOXG_21621 [Fusarium oxysporum f. sp. lycopersici 4287]EXK35731.1 hypothetical protein FOMG_08940 [Fusarium oxysporum f. sp. melonis 26406]KAJ9414923.1 hypothetical protein QL093DRAFT_2105464 [Fusarium oxysporum]KNB16324.1 hypothetical protein FOXG_21621 [Fusarium oxysporum f. sp. lycopersici 4287]
MNSSTHRLLICHVIVSKTRDSLLPAFENKQFSFNPELTDASLLEINTFVKSPDPEQSNISKQFLVGKYGVNLEELWAAFAAVTAYKQTDTVTSNDDTTTSDQATSPLKKPRRSTAPINYAYSGETFGPDDSGPSRSAIESSSYQGSIFV